MAQNMRCDLELQEHCKEKIAFDEMGTNMPDEKDKFEHCDQKIAFDEMPQELDHDVHVIHEKDHVIHEKNVTKEAILSTKPKSKSKRKGLKRHNKVGPLVRDSLCEGDIVSRSISAPISLPEEKESVSCWGGLTAVGMKRRVISGCQRLVSRVRNVNCFRQKPQPRSPSPEPLNAAELKQEDELVAEPDKPEVQFTADREQAEHEVEDNKVEPTASLKLETVNIVDKTGAEYGEIEVQAGAIGDELFKAVAKKLVADVIVQAQARLMAEQAKLMVADIIAKAECNLRYLEVEWLNY